MANRYFKPRLTIILYVMTISYGICIYQDNWLEESIPVAATYVVATPSEQATVQPIPKTAVASSGSTIGTTLPITTDDPRTQVSPPDDSSAPIVDIPFTQGDNNRDGTLALRTGS